LFGHFALIGERKFNLLGTNWSGGLSILVMGFFHSLGLGGWGSLYLREGMVNRDVKMG
jgi:hypothetical protein